MGCVEHGVRRIHVRLACPTHLSHYLQRILDRRQEMNTFSKSTGHYWSFRRATGAGRAMHKEMDG